MALKDNWIPKTNDDYILPNNINSIADSVISLEQIIPTKDGVPVPIAPKDSLDELEYVVEDINDNVVSHNGRLSELEKNVQKNVGINKFDKSTANKGYAIDASGGLALNASRTTTDFIPCYGESVFSCSNSITGRYASYDINKQTISTSTPTSRNNQPIAEGAHYIRVGMGTEKVEGQMVVFAETADDIPYEPYVAEKVLNPNIGVAQDNLGDDVISLIDDTANESSLSLKRYILNKEYSSKNKFNPEAATYGYALNASGIPVVNPERVVTDFIPCYGETVFSCAKSIIGVYCAYDADKNYISGSATTPIAKDGQVIPEGAYYIRIGMEATKVNGQMIIFAETAEGMAYEQYFKKAFLTDDAVVSEENLMAVKHLIPTDFSLITNLFNGCKIKLIGDSITHGVGGTNLEDGTSFPSDTSTTKGDGINGEPIMVNGSITFYTAPNIHCWGNLFKAYVEEKFPDTTVKNHGTRGESYHTMQINNFYRLKQLVSADDDTDIVIMMFGTNDRSYCSDVSDMIAKGSACIEYITITCGKKLILMTATPASVSNETAENNNLHMEDVANVNKYLADKYKLPFVNIYTEFIDRIEEKGESISGYLADGLHPNDEGYDLMFKIILEKLSIANKREGATW